MELINSFFTGPVLPATGFFLLMIAWSLLAMLGAVDIEMPGGDIDVDIDLDVDIDSGGVGAHAADSLGLLALKWLNLKDVPLVLWAGVFAATWWLISACSWLVIDSRFFDPPGLLWSGALVLKNLVITIPLTKLITAPMKKWFVTEQLSASSLIGRECEISSLTASTEFGQVKFQTEGAPLLLNVRTDGPHLARGARVWITHYDAKQRLYIVSPTGTDSELAKLEKGYENE